MGEKYPTIKEILPKAIKGKLVSTPVKVEFKPYTSLITSMIGSIAVIGARRLKATITTMKN